MDGSADARNLSEPEPGLGHGNGHGLSRSCDRLVEKQTGFDGYPNRQFASL